METTAYNSWFKKKLQKCIIIFISIVFCLFWIEQNYSTSSWAATFGISNRKLQNRPGDFFNNVKLFDFSPSTSLSGNKFLKLPKNETFRNCTGLQAVILVKSAFFHFALRKLIRRTWASQAQLKNSSNLVLFLLGKPTENITIAEDFLFNEEEAYGDIIQGDFLDTYENLTSKTIMGMQWATQYCRKTSLILSVDDDTYVDLTSLDKLENSLSYTRKPVKNIMRCGHLLHKRAKVKRKGKWSVPYEVMKSSWYPPYCDGACYVMSKDVLLDIYTASTNSSLDLTIDDALITGILREKARVKLEKIEKNICDYLGKNKRNLFKTIKEKFEKQN